MASVTYGKFIMATVIMAKVLWQMKLSPKIYNLPIRSPNHIIYLVNIQYTIHRICYNEE